MRPLPRLHAVTDAATLALTDLGVRAAAIAALGPAVALHVRDGSATARALAATAERFGALVRPPGAALFINARADLAAAVEAQGVQLGQAELSVPDARRVFPRGWIGRAVHSRAEAEAAVAEGADYLMAGPVFPTGSHPGGPAAGLALVRAAATLGPPVIAIGGVTTERVAELKEAGAWGVAAIRALWHADDPAAAARALLAPWMEEG